MNDKLNLILLPGMSPVNKDWIEEVENELTSSFERTKVQYYDHWEQGGGFKLGAEKKKLRKTAEDFGNYLILAKSVGVFLTIEAMNKQLISPNKCVFLGTTYRSAQLLGDWDIPTLFIQETQDPFLHIADLRPLIRTALAGNSHLVEIEGTTHAYKDVERIRTEVRDFIA